MDDVRRRGQVQTGATGLQRHEQDGGPSRTLESLDESSRFFAGRRRAATAAPCRSGERGRAQQVAPLGELREAEDPVALGDDLVEQLLDPGQLAGPTGEERTVVEVVGRVIADLLEAQKPGQHPPAAIDAFGLVGVAQELVDDGLVERGLLPRAARTDRSPRPCPADR